MILDEIVAHKRIEVAERKKHVAQEELLRLADSLPPPRDFEGALRGGRVALIAEIKRASPSRGTLRFDVEPERQSRLYAEHGAAAISVLTDRKFFQGDPDTLAEVRPCGVPLLRKDFICDEYQVVESRALQADAILLIVRVLDLARLKRFLEMARSLKMASLVEAHDEAEIERALEAGASTIGINNRNLADFTVDLAVTERLARLVPSAVICVSESGIRSRADVERAAGAGADAVLVGEALMLAGDTAAAVRGLSQVERRGREPAAARTVER